MKITNRLGPASHLLIVLMVFSGITSGSNLKAEPTTTLDRSKVCMLEDTVQSHDGLEQTYNGKTYYLCCQGCVAAFRGNPEKYSHATDPVDGSRVDKADAPFYPYGGRAYFFSSQQNLHQFAQQPDRYLRHGASL